MTISKLFNLQSKFLLLTLCTGVFLFLFTACNDDNGPEESNPEITSVRPLRGAVGTTVTITGSGFSPIASENNVSFGGTEAEVIEASESELVVTVPEGAETGAIEVTVDGNTVTGPNFTVEDDTTGGMALEITSVEPDSGAVGTEVVIYGSGFSATPDSNTVTFNGTEAPIISASTDSLQTEVPEGATDGPIEVTVGGETATGPDFNVLEGDTTSS